MIRRYKELYKATSAGTSDWVDLDSRYEHQPERALVISLTSGDTFELQAIVKDVKGTKAEVDAMLAALSSADITSLKTYTQSENDIMKGNWRYIRVIKTGANGAGLFAGFV